MQSIKVNREKLISKLIANRVRHVKTYRQAIIGFKLRLVSRLKAMLAFAKAGKFAKAMNVSLSTPVSHEKDYTRTIDMLRMSVEKEIDLTTAEYVQYVEDRWMWSADAFTNSVYAKAAVAVRRKR